MEDNYNQNDFEEFLREEVRNHRMYPSDAVWRDIDKKLHGEKRWPALTIAASILIGATVLICLYFTPKPDIFSIQHTTPSTNSTQEQLAENNVLNNLTSSTPFQNATVDNNVPAQTTQQNASIAKSNATTEAKDITDVVVEETATSQSAKHVAKTVGSGTRSTQPQHKKTIEHPQTETSSTTFNVEPLVENPSVVLNNETTATPKKLKKSSKEPSANKDYNDKNMVDKFLKDHKSEVAVHSSQKQKNAKSRFSYQIYIAPSVSYRKLIEDRSMLKDNNGGPVGLNYVADVNNIVRHKPGNGVEAGVSFMYSLSPKFRIKTGFQFNVRQYSIQAFRSNTELANIALKGDNNRVDTVTTLAVYRTNNGLYSTELVNKYYQVAMPLGVEWEVIGNQNVQLNVAASIQPTYLINRNAYLLSTNFKNYTESPEIVRPWNINSNIEAFVSFKVGDFKWQFGPQLRYQPYSTFIPEYPIKEHLLDYGIKFGVSRTIKSNK